MARFAVIAVALLTFVIGSFLPVPDDPQAAFAQWLAIRFVATLLVAWALLRR